MKDDDVFHAGSDCAAVAGGRREARGLRGVDGGFGVGGRRVRWRARRRDDRFHLSGRVDHQLEDDLDLLRRDTRGEGRLDGRGGLGDHDLGDCRPRHEGRGDRQRRRDGRRTS